MTGERPGQRRRYHEEPRRIRPRVARPPFRRTDGSTDPLPMGRPALLRDRAGSEVRMTMDEPTWRDEPCPGTAKSRFGNGMVPLRYAVGG